MGFHTNLHLIRHSHASILVREKEHPAEVARRLGHDIKTLLDNYVHKNDENAKRIAKDFEDKIMRIMENKNVTRKPHMD
ncbi:hypothetical protein [Natranaerofaba carboxydovora]|uniref:hypothetical protein n=1 Tax=Natranaerofaba carboxydovora TaxID=2742683 RepID=UPI001F145ED3|nr:hypothetical protein [Natranaerofaba carboxydovora]